MKKGLLAASPMFPRSLHWQGGEGTDQKERVQVPILFQAGLALCLPIPAPGSRVSRAKALCLGEPGVSCHAAGPRLFACL